MPSFLTITLISESPVHYLVDTLVSSKFDYYVTLFLGLLLIRSSSFTLYGGADARFFGLIGHEVVCRLVTYAGCGAYGGLEFGFG